MRLLVHLKNYVILKVVIEYQIIKTFLQKNMYKTFKTSSL